MLANQMCGGTIRMDLNAEFSYRLESIGKVQLIRPVHQQSIQTSQYQFERAFQLVMD